MLLVSWSTIMQSIHEHSKRNKNWFQVIDTALSSLLSLWHTAMPHHPPGLIKILHNSHYFTTTTAQLQIVMLLWHTFLLPISLLHVSPSFFTTQLHDRAEATVYKQLFALVSQLTLHFPVYVLSHLTILCISEVLCTVLLHYVLHHRSEEMTLRSNISKLLFIVIKL